MPQHPYYQAMSTLALAARCTSVIKLVPATSTPSHPSLTVTK